MNKKAKRNTAIVLGLLLSLNFSYTCFAKSTNELENKQRTRYTSTKELLRGNNYSPSKFKAYFTSDAEKGTHQFIVRQALIILKNDKGDSVGVQKFIRENESILNEYCAKPDKDEDDYGFAYHFYNPNSGENYLPSFLPQSKITALIRFREHAENAVNNYKTDKELAIEELGRACHYLQDVNVPYHAANLIAGLSTHSQYESFVENHEQNYVVNTSDKYTKYSSFDFDDYCNSILKDCAKYAYSFKDSVVNDENSWNSVADKTVKYSEQYVSAFFYRFLQEVGEI